MPKMLSVITNGTWCGTVSVEKDGVQKLCEASADDKNFNLNEFFDEKTNTVKIKIDGVKSKDMSVEIVVKDSPF